MDSQRNNQVQAAVSYAGILTARTTPEQAREVLSLLDDDSLETEALYAADPMESIKDSRTAWVRCGDTSLPICCYGLQELPGSGAFAWMMTTRLVRSNRLGGKLIALMHAVLSAAVKRYERVEGVCRIDSDIPRMLRLLGATFSLHGHPKFLRWELHGNYRLSGGAH